MIDIIKSIYFPISNILGDIKSNRDKIKLPIIKNEKNIRKLKLNPIKKSLILCPVVS